MPNNAVNTSLFGQEGTGSFVGDTSPTITSATLVTPDLGVAEATSLQFTSDVGIIGQTSGNPAPTGSVGELISSVNVSPGVSLTTATPTDMNNVSIGAGEWLITGNLYFTVGSGIDSITVRGWINTTSATEPDPSQVSEITLQATAVGNIGFTLPPLNINTVSSMTVFISCTSDFSTSTVSVCGQLIARRIG